MYPVSQTAGYDRVATMFSPDGRLYQVEYASKIVGQGTLGIGLKYADGVIFGADKKVPSRLILPESIEKLFLIDTHIAAVSARLAGGARRLVEIARQKAQENIQHYDESIGVETLVKEIGSIKQAFTQYGGMRPFGIAFIIGGVDSSGTRLFETEPSGALAEYQAVAIGQNKNKAMELFEKQYREGMSLDGAVALGLKAIKAGLEGKQRLDPKSIEFAYIDSSRKFKRVPGDKIKSFLSSI